MKIAARLCLISLLILVTACRKDQRKVNRIEGKWSVVYAELPNFGKIEPDLIFKFDWCKVRFDDYCDFSLNDFNLESIRFGIYKVSKDGNSLTLSFEDSGYSSFEVFSIERLNFRTLILENTNTQSMYYSKFRLRSID